MGSIEAQLASACVVGVVRHAAVVSNRGGGEWK